MQIFVLILNIVFLLNQRRRKGNNEISLMLSIFWKSWFSPRYKLFVILECIKNKCFFVFFFFLVCSLCYVPRKVTTQPACSTSSFGLITFSWSYNFKSFPFSDLSSQNCHSNLFNYTSNMQLCHFRYLSLFNSSLCS